MSRPIKKGLSYFPLDTDMLSDRKIRRLFQNYGCEGFSTYMAILCEAYGTTGYYIRYTDDFCFDIGFTLNLKENRSVRSSDFVLRSDYLIRNYSPCKESSHLSESNPAIGKSTSGAYPVSPPNGNPGRDRPYFYGRNIGSCYRNPGFSDRNSPKRKRKRK